jgi:hypothetical protein
MLDHITPYQELLSEVKEIQSFSEITVSDNPQEIAERIVALEVYIARTGKMLADAKFHLLEKQKDESIKLLERIFSKQKLSAKVQNAIIEPICIDERYLVSWIERLNRAVTHQHDGMRSLLSYEKENLRVTKTGY